MAKRQTQSKSAPKGVKTVKATAKAKSPKKAAVPKKAVSTKKAAATNKTVSAKKPVTAKKKVSAKAVQKAAQKRKAPTSVAKAPVKTAAKSSKLTGKTPKPLVRKPVATAKAQPLEKGKTTAKAKATVKAPVKTRVKTATEAKAQTKSPTPTASNKETVASLRAHIDRITTMLKGADTKTRKSVKSLEAAYAALEKQVKDHHHVNHAALTRRVDQLTSFLTSSLAETKRTIATELKSAIQNPSAGGLDAALQRSEQRLSVAEHTRSQALTKINRHIAELARAIDSRFKTTQSRIDRQSEKLSEIEASVSSVQSLAYDRIRAVEDTTAAAIRKIGDDVLKTAENYQTKLERQNLDLREKMNDVAAQTQKDFDQQRNDLSTRMENLENSVRNHNLSLDRTLNNLSDRLDKLEFGLTQPLEQTAAAAMSPIEYEDAFAVAAAEISAPTDIVPPQPSVAEAPVQSPVPSNIEHFPVPEAYVAPVQPEYGSLPAYGNQAEAALDMPQEFQPGSNQPAQPVQHHYVDPAQAALLPPVQTQPAPVQDAFAYPELPPAAEMQTPTQMPVYDPSEGPIEFVPDQAFSANELPYDNPGYGETATAIPAPETVSEPAVSRPGHIENPHAKKSGRKKKVKDNSDGESVLSKLPVSGRNLRVAVLAVALAGLGFFGLKSFMGGDALEPAQVSTQPSSIVPAGEAPVLVSEVLTIEPTAQIDGSAGIIAGTDIPVITASTADAGSLEDAAKGGNAVAQFQLGISYLDAGRTQDGIKYIRSAANQGQPAAQYRLAKLYEAGVGVTADPKMARQLTERAALAGNRVAMHDLGLYYAEGRGGVAPDMTTALSWFEKAAERGVVDSQYNLGVLYGSTPEIKDDFESAYVWFSIASKQGDQLASGQLTNLKANMTKSEIDRADRRIAQFKPTSIDEAANGIFRDVPWTLPEQDMRPSADLVRDAQSLLGQLGYEVGVPDGDMGPKTQAAVIAFERSNGLPETGAISASLIDRLEAAAGV
ncbi:MAG: hypothetical protein HKN36_05340 [Hellea sp.]|nr:hypothetical protein [Hellea sp.]